MTSRDLLPFAPILLGKSSNTKHSTVTNIQRSAPSGFSSILLAEDIMKRSPLVVSMNIPLSDAARIMIKNRISGLPVVNNKGLLTGVITKTDIITAYVKL